MGRDSVVSRIFHEHCEKEPELTAGGLWWQKLDPDFSRRLEPFELELRDKAQVEATAFGDVVLRTVGACLLGGLAMSVGFHPLALYRTLRDRELYGSLAESGDASRFFVDPPKDVAVEGERTLLSLFYPDDGVCEDLRFESPFTTVNSAHAKTYAGLRQNRTAHARFWRHRSGLRPTIIAVHGFSADFYHLNEWFFGIPQLYAQGYDILLATLPFHGRRQARFSPFSGHGFFAGGVSHINEAFAQAVFDLRIFMNHLFASGVPQIGVMGVSLGGLTSALLASADDRLAFAIPNVPVASLGDLALEWTPIGSGIRAALALTGTSIVELRQWLAPSCPLTYRPKLPRERLMIIGGVGDRLVPPKHPRLLWDHWGRPRIHWYPGSHLIHLDRGEYLDEIARFFSEIGFR